MNEAFIKACKTYVNAGNLSGLQTYYAEIQQNNYGYNPNWEYIYHRIYLHACLKKQQHIVGDFMVHILPVSVLFFFYRILEKRFYYSETSILKSALFPAILSIIYICTHNVETVYKSSDLSSFVIIILTVSVWLSSYQIFIPKKCSFIRVKNNWVPYFIRWT